MTAPSKAYKVQCSVCKVALQRPTARKYVTCFPCKAKRHTLYAKTVGMLPKSTKASKYKIKL